jgi:hypothetical protein
MGTINVQQSKNMAIGCLLVSALIAWFVIKPHAILYHSGENVFLFSTLAIQIGMWIVCFKNQVETNKPWKSYGTFFALAGFILAAVIPVGENLVALHPIQF